MMENAKKNGWESWDGKVNWPPRLAPPSHFKDANKKKSPLFLD